METLPKIQRSPDFKESSNLGDRENKPEKRKFDPEKDIHNILNSLKERGLFNEFQVNETIKGSTRAYHCRIVVSKLSSSIKRNKDKKEEVPIIFSIVSQSINTNPKNLIFFNSSSDRESIERKVLNMIDKKLAKKDKNKEEARKGLESERKIFDVLNLLRNQKLINHFSKSEFDDDIKRKRDFMIDYKSFIVPLQVKSSYSGQTKHMKDDQGVPSIIISKDDTETQIKLKILKILEAYTQEGDILHL